MNETLPPSLSWSHLPILVVLASGLFFARLDTALLEPEETRYAEISREMFVASEWVVPLHRGQPYYDKPPLLYWLALASYSVFGVHDWATRLVPGVCSILSVLVIYDWGRRAFGARTGFLGAVVLALSPRFVYLGRFVATDAPFSLCILCALACTHLAVTGPKLRWQWWIGGGLACGAGLLAKGPTIFVLVGIPAAVYLLFHKNAVRPSVRAYLGYLGLALLIALPWYVAVQMRDSDFAEYFFWKHHIMRYFAPFDHHKPFWFYWPGIVAGTLPWSLLLIPICVQLWHDRRLLASRRAPASIFPLLAALWCLFFFSASGSKRVGYVLPALPPLALAFGIHLDFWLIRVANATAPFALTRVLPLATTMLGILAAAGLAVFHYWTIALAVATTLALIGSAVVLLQRRLTHCQSLFICSVIMTGMCLVGVEWILPEYAERFSLRSEVLQVRDQIPSSANVVCFPRQSDAVAHYLQRNDIVVFNEQQYAAAVAYFREHAEVWLFLHDGDASRRLLADLLTSMSVEERARHGSNAVFRVRSLNSMTLALTHQ